MRIRQGRLTASHDRLAFLPFLDLRAVMPGGIRASSQNWRRKQAKEEKASKEERRQREWQGMNVGTKLRGRVESRRRSLPISPPAPDPQWKPGDKERPSARKCSRPFKVMKIHERESDLKEYQTGLSGSPRLFLFTLGTSPHLIQGDLANPGSHTRVTWSHLVAAILRESCIVIAPPPIGLVLPNTREVSLRPQMAQCPMGPSGRDQGEVIPAHVTRQARITTQPGSMI